MELCQVSERGEAQYEEKIIAAAV
jgi:hypothetical protein